MPPRNSALLQLCTLPDGPNGVQSHLVSGKVNTYVRFTQHSGAVDLSLFGGWLGIISKHRPSTGERNRGRATRSV